jgi:hypothetical protein
LNGLIAARNDDGDSRSVPEHAKIGGTTIGFPGYDTNAYVFEFLSNFIYLFKQLTNRQKMGFDTSDCEKRGPK